MIASFANRHRFLTFAIALVVFSAFASCNSKDSTPTSPSAATLVITITSNNGAMSFSPESASVTLGQTVAWRNADTIVHAIAQDGGGFSTGSIAAGATSVSVMASAAGTLPYHCTIHPSMTGSVTVH